MASTLRHRGPDDGGSWADAAAGIALGHRRLSILDLSPTGAPADALGVGALRHRLQRRDLQLPASCAASSRTAARGSAGGIRHRGDAGGVRALGARTARSSASSACSRSRSGTARSARCISCATGSARSRSTTAGCGGALLFGSELKALRAHPAFRRESRSRGAGALPAPRLRAGAVLDLPGHPQAAARHVVLTRAARTSVESPSTPTGRRARSPRRGVRQPLRGQRRRAGRRARGAAAATRCALQMVADVPLGAFLSGGDRFLDVVALMQAAEPRPVKTFTIGFDEDRLRRGRAREGGGAPPRDRPHRALRHAGQARDVIPRLPSLYDEPFADSSQIPDLPRRAAGPAARHRRALRATAATSSSAATTATSAAGASGARSRPVPRAVRAGRRARHTRRVAGQLGRVARCRAAGAALAAASGTAGRQDAQAGGRARVRAWSACIAASCRTGASRRRWCSAARAAPRSLDEPMPGLDGTSATVERMMYWDARHATSPTTSW